ncbi:MAG: branched-chain amino acid ABC transporter permease [Pseudolysinimonas sp.]
MLNLAIAGLTAGVAYAALGLCLVLTHYISNLINVSQAIVGGIGAFVFVRLYDPHNPIWFPIIVGLLASGMLAALQGAIIARWFADANSAARTATTIAMGIAFLALAQRIFGYAPQVFPLLLNGSVVKLDATNVPVATIVAVGALLLLVLGLRAAFARSRIGLRVRAVSLLPRTAEILGVRSRVLVPAVWAVSGALAMLSLLVVMPTRQADLGAIMLLVVPALAAALLGSMRRFEVVLIAGLGIGVIESLLLAWPEVAPYRQAVSFVVIIAGLLLGQRKVVWHEAR